MKKVKVEHYEKPNYSTLKMVTGKILPAGLVIATMMTGIPTANAVPTEMANTQYSLDEKSDLSATMGEVPSPTSTVEPTRIPAMGGGVPYPTPTPTKEPDGVSALPGVMPMPTPTPVGRKLITVVINQVAVEFDVKPILENGRVLVPLRKIFEVLGASVTWNDETKTATATMGNDVIVIRADDPIMLKNGQEITLDVTAKIVDSRMLVPVRAIAEGLVDCDVLWNEYSQQVIIDYKTPPPTRPPGNLEVTAGIMPLPEG